jgi:hypothetical protein
LIQPGIAYELRNKPVGKTGLTQTGIFAAFPLLYRRLKVLARSAASTIIAKLRLAHPLAAQCCFRWRQVYPGDAAPVKTEPGASVMLRKRMAAALL